MNPKSPNNLDPPGPSPAESSAGGYSAYRTSLARHFRIAQYSPSLFRQAFVGSLGLFVVLTLATLRRIIYLPVVTRTEEDWRVRYFLYYLYSWGVSLGIVYVQNHIRQRTQWLCTFELIVFHNRLVIVKKGKRKSEFAILRQSIRNVWIERRWPTAMSLLMNYRRFRVVIQTRQGAFLGFGLKIEPGVDLLQAEADLRRAMGLHKPTGERKLRFGRVERIVFEEPVSDNKNNELAL